MAARKTAKKAKEKMTTSKKIILASYAVGIILTIVLIIGAFKGFDMTTIGIVTGTAYAEIAASNAFYFWKAKKENVLKIALSALDKVPDDKVDDVVKILGTLGGIGGI